jgi:hypothetical protein
MMADTEVKEVEYMLTTVDNPFDPFSQFDEWLAYDTKMGYHSASFLDRIAKVSSDLSAPDQEKAIQDAIEEIVNENVLGVWKKVARGSMTTF